jgi:excisionase family DNA binding protein
VVSELVSVRAAAKALGVHENTIRNWESSGVLHAVRLPSSRFRRFERDEVDRIKQSMHRSESTSAKPDGRLARVLRLLQENETRLRRRGVAHVSVFGSTARGEAGADSDVDLAIELDPRKKIDIFDFAAIGAELQRILPFHVDAVSRKDLKAHVVPSALKDEILDNIVKINSYIGKMTFEAFACDAKTQDAVERCLERISEAARKIGDQFDTKYPDVEFDKLRQLGSVFRHDYDVVSLPQVWAARKRLAQLEIACRAELELEKEGRKP